MALVTRSKSSPSASVFILRELQYQPADATAHAIQHGFLLLFNAIKSKSQALKPRTSRHKKSNQTKTI